MKKVALITGGTRGIGLGISRNLAQAGFDLAVNGVRPESAVSSALEELRGLGAHVLYCRGDVSSAVDRKRIIEQVRQRFGALHILINNAGVAPLERRDILEATEESFERVMSINLKGPYFLTQQVASWMIEQKRSGNFDGCIINVSSISATVASTNRGEYCISKSGIAMATQLFAARLGEFEIPVYEIRPGVIDTDMTASAREKYDRLIQEGRFVQGRWGTADDVGKAAAALAEQKFPYSTGQVFLVDGGLTIQRL